MLFWSENGYTLCPVWSGIGYGFRENNGSVLMYLLFQFQMSKKEREIYTFEMDFDEFVFLCSNLSNDIINFCLKARSENGYGFERSGPKTSTKNYSFWSEIWSEFGELGSTPPPRIPRGTSPWGNVNSNESSLGDFSLVFITIN